MGRKGQPSGIRALVSGMGGLLQMALKPTLRSLITDSQLETNHHGAPMAPRLQGSSELRQKPLHKVATHGYHSVGWRPTKKIIPWHSKTPKSAFLSHLLSQKGLFFPKQYSPSGPYPGSPSTVQNTAVDLLPIRAALPEFYTQRLQSAKSAFLPLVSSDYLEKAVAAKANSH